MWMPCVYLFREYDKKNCSTTHMWSLQTQYILKLFLVVEPMDTEYWLCCVKCIFNWGVWIPQGGKNSLENTGCTGMTLCAGILKNEQILLNKIFSWKIELYIEVNRGEEQMVRFAFWKIILIANWRIDWLKELDWQQE
jgi:hypothetical protein